MNFKFKNTKLKSAFILPMAICSVFVGCNGKSNGTSTGTPFVSMAITGSSSSVIASFKSLKQKFWEVFFNEAIALVPPPNIVDSAGHSIAISNFWINFGNVEFESTQLPNSSEIDGANIVLSGPLTIDLLSPSPLIFGPFNLRTVGFQRLKYKAQNLQIATATSPSGLTGNSLFLSGTVSGTAFTVQVSDQIEIEVSGPSAVTPSTNSQLILQMSTISIFSKINLTGLVGSPKAITSSNKLSQANPCPQINVSAADLYTCFRDAIAVEANVGEDQNLDFQIDNNEPSIK